MSDATAIRVTEEHRADRPKPMSAGYFVDLVVMGLGRSITAEEHAICMRYYEMPEWPDRAVHAIRTQAAQIRGKE